MANLGKIVYLSEEQKEELFENDTITVDGVTINYSENDIYVTPQAKAAPITSPAFTGIPTAPTATAGTSTNQLATTAFVQEAVGNASSGLVKRSIVQTLPQSDIDSNTIYMIPKITAELDNAYNEFMYINNNWELIGSTEVDLSNYLQNSDIAAWAKAANKPTYTASEVGAVSTTGNAYRSVSIPFGQVDGTSTSTAYTASVPGITELRNGVCCYLKNGVVTSATGWTLDVNSLGAKPVYQTLAAATRITTTFNINYTMLFVYNEDRVTDGCWDMYYGYNSDSVNMRRGNGQVTIDKALYRYQFLFSKDINTMTPTNQTSNSTGTSKTLTTDSFDPLLPIFYYNTTGTKEIGNMGVANLFEQYSSCDMRYGFNCGKTLTSYAPVFLVVVPQPDGLVKLHSSPLAQALPQTEDGLYYIYLGRTYSSYQMTMDYYKPVFYFKDGKIRRYTGCYQKADTTPTQNSSNLITSGAVYTALGNIETLLGAL